MTHEQLDAIMDMSSRSRRFVAPVCDTQLGRELSLLAVGLAGAAMKCSGRLVGSRTRRTAYVCSEWLAADMAAA